MQVDAPDWIQFPLVQVKLAEPLLVFVEVTLRTTPLTPAVTFAVQVTPATPCQFTAPPLHGLGDVVPPPDGTHDGIGVFTDQSWPGGHAKPGLMAGDPSAAV